MKDKTLDEILMMQLNNELNAEEYWNELCRNYILTEDIKINGVGILYLNIKN